MPSARAGNALCLAALLCAAFHSVAEEPPADPKTPEQFQAGFAQAVATRNWQLLEKVADGLKATGLRGAELEVVVLRGERDAALSARGSAGQVITWGLACRAKSGDAQALEALRELSKTNPPASSMPDGELWRRDQAAAHAALKAFQDANVTIEKRDEALLCLALLKEPNLYPRILECLTTSRAAAPIWVAMAPQKCDPLVLAALLADPQAGWGKLLEFLSRQDAEAPAKGQLRVLLALTGLLPKNRVVWGQQPKDALVLDGQAYALLPKDTETQLLKPFASFLNRCPMDGEIWMPLTSLLNMARSLPKQGAGSELVQALEALKTKLAGGADPGRTHVTYTLANVLAYHKGEAPAPPTPGGPSRPVEPPKAPTDF
jgi:hypothetical protein